MFTFKMIQLLLNSNSTPAKGTKRKVIKNPYKDGNNNVPEISVASAVPAPDNKNYPGPIRLFSNTIAPAPTWTEEPICPLPQTIAPGDRWV